MFSYKSPSKNKILTKSRGVSQVIASLFMLAIVASFGSVLLLQGMTGINDFNSFLAIFSESETLSVQESIMIEHIRFTPSANNAVNIWIRNDGAVEVTIDTITIVKVDTQDLIVDTDEFTIVDSDEITKDILVKDFDQITIDTSDVSLPTDCTNWSDTDCRNDAYLISITTSRGNTFVATAQPLVT